MLVSSFSFLAYSMASSRLKSRSLTIAIILISGARTRNEFSMMRWSFPVPDEPWAIAWQPVFLATSARASARTGLEMPPELRCPSAP
ncbi:Uncharacterised protein [uncultured archaeon]|nr:Uncharacterised protein [uncultured archaeon]